MELTRRRLLTTGTAVAGIGGLAGCVDGSIGQNADSNTADTTTARSSFFVFGDVASRIAGSAADAELLVPVGQHGHGWEPGPSVREEIHEADLFVHGMEGFQPWVDTIKHDLEADGSDVVPIDASAGISLIEAGDSGHDHDDEHGDDHTDDEHGDDHTDEHGDDHTDDEHGHDHDDEHGDDHTDEHDDEHGEGMDPHFWMDPLRMKDTVETVRQGLTDVDPENADVYAENAESFSDRLDELHGEIESIVANASNDVILIAGHDSFGYFSDRYDVRVEALTSVSPDDIPTPQDIQNAQEIISTHDLRYICADPLESQQAAEQLVAETDIEEVLPLTAMPGLTDEWAADDWGYLDVMESVNLPTIERIVNT
ncbi:metal ABC transporter substrate-binding protein [Natronomonas sp.]|uniref:metal ABC transporter substrate-binding protein n=1 Tax=Natronomonas sp. TaxID=2184060 RepID=UPI0039766EB5